MTRRGHAHWYAVIIMVIVFLNLQIGSIDYGTQINNLPHIVNYQVGSNVVEGSALERDNISGAGAGESIDRWNMRFKLYSVEADEHLNIMALARIKPGERQFDPHYYQYGGAWLYPLGAWYFALSKTGIVSVVPLEVLLAEPDKMDAVYIWGRTFTLVSVALAAIVLFLVAQSITTPWSAVLVTAIFLSAPATIMFSQIMKPHWYALLWVNLSLFGVVRGWLEKNLGFRYQFMIGATLGMAVGSATTFALFAIGVWLALAVMVRRQFASLSSLVLVPVIALGIFFATNPFIFLNWSGYSAEAKLAAGWFVWALSLGDIWSFIENSFAAGFGVVFTITLAITLVYAIFGSNTGNRRGLGIALVIAVLLVAMMTSLYGAWHSNVRYLPWVMPATLLFLSTSDWKGRNAMLIVVLLGGVIQTTPLALAYHDESSERYSTRLTAKRWIEKNVPTGAELCFQTKTLAPFDVPPINFTHYRVNAPSCNTFIAVEREPDAVQRLEGYQLVERFTPRYSFQAFPLVFGHINPQISIYQRD